MLGVAGVTAIEAKVTGGGVAAVTVSEAVPLTPESVAVRVAEPAATAVASPEALMVATEVLDEVHEAVVEIFAVDPSL
jgi:flavin reductase (DIM6/NTAB) family NADH-FMN oxidoreductase RutF